MDQSYGEAEPAVHVTLFRQFTLCWADDEEI
jgi:hypothetical protein